MQCICNATATLRHEPRSGNNPRPRQNRRPYRQDDQRAARNHRDGTHRNLPEPNAQKELARRVGVAPSTIRNIERASQPCGSNRQDLKKASRPKFEHCSGDCCELQFSREFGTAGIRGVSKRSLTGGFGPQIRPEKSPSVQALAADFVRSGDCWRKSLFLRIRPGTELTRNQSEIQRKQSRGIAQTQRIPNKIFPSSSDLLSECRLRY